MNNLLLGTAILVAGFSSCKNETEVKAKATVESFTKYVDSVSSIAETEAKANWQAIESGFKQKTEQAETALVGIKEKNKASIEEKINASKAKFEMHKARLIEKFEEEKAKAIGEKDQVLRNSFFGEGKVTGDLNFDWVNKDNILTTYKEFVSVFKKNKDSYSEEDFNKIKTMYKALDARKNMVEKQGLSAKDNSEISKLKSEFTPKFKREKPMEVATK